jgi:glycerol-3-phosphate dehydrogenase (NAD(P)+)
MKYNYAIIGGGSWATAITKILSEQCDQLIWWMRDDEQIAHIQKHRHNPKYIQSVDFDLSKITLTSDIELAIKGAQKIIVATPSAFIHDVFKNLELRNKKIISAVKGIIPQTNEIPADYFHHHFGISIKDFAVICGPCHAEEVAQERLSYLTIAGEDNALIEKLADDMSCRYIRCTTTNDVIGAELSAILKNIYALCGGICHGLGYGDNFLAVLVSNAIQEIERFINAVYPVTRDVKLSAYLGDLLVTAYSPHSRNRTFGNMVGKGYSVKAIQQEMNMVAEGYYATNCIHALNAKHQVKLPIASAVYNILYANANAKSEIDKLAKLLS